MTATAQIRIEGQISGLPGGSVKVGPIDLTSAAANGQVQWTVLQSGANTITCPVSPAPSGVIIVLPSANTAVVTLKGITGDTGIALGKTTAHVLGFDPTAVPTSFCLTSAATQTGLATQIIFF